MKTEKLVEQRIEKHLDLVEHNKEYYTEAEKIGMNLNDSYNIDHFVFSDKSEEYEEESEEI